MTKRINLDLNYIEKEYKKGKSTEDMSKELKVCRQTITNRLKEMNIQIRNPGFFTERARDKLKKSRQGKFIGENNPNFGKKLSKQSRKIISAKKQGVELKDWKGFSHREPYDQNWNDKFKQTIRKRDNQVCMMCGIHREKLSKALDVHHINYNKKLSIPQNCVSLCNKCHLITNRNRGHWIKFFQSLLNERCDYQYSKNQEIILKCPLNQKNNAHI